MESAIKSEIANQAQLNARYERDVKILEEMNRNNPDWYAPSFYDWCVAQRACSTLETPTSDLVSIQN